MARKHQKDNLVQLQIPRLTNRRLFCHEKRFFASWNLSWSTPGRAAEWSFVMLDDDPRSLSHFFTRGELSGPIELPPTWTVHQEVTGRACVLRGAASIRLWRTAVHRILSGLLMEVTLSRESNLKHPAWLILAAGRGGVNDTAIVKKRHLSYSFFASEHRPPPPALRRTYSMCAWQNSWCVARCAARLDNLLQPRNGGRCQRLDSPGADWSRANVPCDLWKETFVFVGLIGDSFANCAVTPMSFFYETSTQKARTGYRII